MNTFIALFIICALCLQQSSQNIHEEDGYVQWFGKNCENTCTIKGLVNSPPTLMMSFDGIGKMFLEKKILKVLDDVAKCGAKAKKMFPSFPTKTFSNHYTMATGAYPGDHGIVDNYIYAGNSTGNKALRGSRINDPKLFMKEPIWSAAAREGHPTYCSQWFGCNIPFANHSLHGQWQREWKEPSLLEQFNSEMSLAEELSSILRWLKKIKNEAEQGHSTSKSSLMLAYFNEPGGIAHDFFGELNKNYSKINQKIDEYLHDMERQLRHFLLKAAQEGILNCVNIIFVSDHGFEKIVGVNSPYDQKDWESIVPKKVLPKHVVPTENTVPSESIQIDLAERKLSCHEVYNIKGLSKFISKYPGGIERFSVEYNKKFEPIEQRYRSNKINLEEYNAELKNLTAEFKNFIDPLKANLKKDNVNKMIFSMGTIATIYKGPSKEPIENVLKVLKCQKHYRVYDKSSMPVRWHYTQTHTAELVLVSELGFIFKRNEPIPNLMAYDRGYDYYHPNMDAIFYAVGPSIVPGVEVESFQNTEVFNLLADLIGLDPKKIPANSGIYGLLHPLLRKFHQEKLHHTKGERSDAPSYKISDYVDFYIDTKGAKIEQSHVSNGVLFFHSQTENENFLPHNAPTILMEILAKKETHLHPSKSSNDLATIWDQVDNEVIKNQLLDWLQGLTKNYLNKYENLVTITGTIFDHNQNGIADSVEGYNLSSEHSVGPTHIFRIIVRCEKDAKTGKSGWHGKECKDPEESLRTMAFVLPLVENYNCISADEYLLENTAPIKDVELLTGVKFFKGISQKDPLLYKKLQSKVTPKL